MGKKRTLWTVLILLAGAALLIYWWMYRAQVKEIRLSTQEEDLHYVEGLPPDFSDLIFEVTFENNKTKTITGSRLTFTEVNVDQIGVQKVVATYRNKEVSFFLWIREKQLESIEILEPPSVVTYIEGQAVQLQGIKVKAHYDNGEEEVISFESLVLGAYDQEHIGSQEILVYLGDHGAVFEVEYIPKTLLELELQSPPNHRVLPEKVDLDLTGLVVEALYDNGIPVVVDQGLLEITGYDKTKLGTQTVTAKFQGHSVNFTVVVEPKKEVGITIVTKPSKVVYEHNQSFDSQGLSVALLYNNGEQVILSNQDITITGFAGNVIGTQNVSVRYGSFQSGFEIRVKPLMVPNPDGLDVVVNKERALSQGFVPSGLIKVSVPVVYASTEGNKMKGVAAQALFELFAAGKASGIELLARSGYRSYQTQSTLYANSVKKNGVAYANKYSAQPGHSEHQTGLAMDVTASSVNSQLITAFGTTKEGLWLADNAHQYGFIIRYPKGKETITGYAYEPWHLRYVGKKVANEVFQQGITLEEYYGLK